MAAAVNVESDGSIRDLFQDPPFNLENVRFDVSGLASRDDLDVETLETLYNQLLQEIYDRTGVTALYPPGQFPGCHDATVKLLMKNHGLMGTESFTKFTGYRTLQRQAKSVAGQDQELPEDIKNLIPCPYAPVLLSSIALVIFRKPPTGSPSNSVISMFCAKKVVKWLNLAIRIYETNRSHLMYISVDDGYNLDDGRQSLLIQHGDKKYLRVKSHTVDDSVFQHEIDQYFDPEWTGFSDHDNPSDNEMDLDSQHDTSNESVQPDSDDKLQKLYTMLRRHEPVFLKFSQESPQILVNSASAARDLMQLTILVNKTNEIMEAEAKRQTEHDKNMMTILKYVDHAYQDIQTRIGTLQQRLTESVAENLTKINASMQERLTETVTGISTQVNASMQNGAELYEQAVLSAFEESDILKTIIEKAVAELQPHVNRQIVNGDNALDEDMQ
ncbi:hypothetical protein H9Q69_011026 [Fusarium xylarioides]|uniref:Uncharacterized protein n=1 Tax=Fusarium xylarioides TaxID=221167 RepID=A0A9P7HGJ8_9HYPO|nr:hypothetical protein H9Q72_012951 [Fusarium xylarioides]KAG5789918.1 hypothetical protein H9Q69_011026 [Fusarium xylarioides]